jgi:hypothetical protein
LGRKLGRVDTDRVVVATPAWSQQRLQASRSQRVETSVAPADMRAGDKICGIVADPIARLQPARMACAQVVALEATESMSTLR